MKVYLKPDWNSRLKVSYEYLTTIFETESGREQRSAERTRPRRTYEFTALLSGDELRALRAHLHSALDQTLYIPEPDYIIGTVSHYAALGATSIRTVEPLPSSLVGRQICAGKGSFATVQSISGGLNLTVNLTSPLEKEVQPGDEVRIVIGGLLNNSTMFSYATDSFASVKVVFRAMPGGSMRSHGSPVAPTFRGRDVLTHIPDWSNPPEVEIINPYEMVDFNRGVVDAYTTIEFVSKVTQLNYMGRDSQTMWPLIDFFVSSLGRRNEFWSPSWTADLSLAQDISNGNGFLIAKGEKPYQYYSDSKVETALAVRLENEWMFRAIDSIVPSGANSRINLNPIFTKNIKREAVHGLFLLNVCRFASDMLTVEWLTDALGQVVLQTKTLESLTAEVP